MTWGKPIIKSRVRIFRPAEFTALLSSTPDDWKPLLSALLYTGMRYVEAVRFRANPDWFDGSKFVYLPEAAVEKHLRKQKERWVRLNPQGVEAVKAALASSEPYPSWWTWKRHMRQWAKSATLDPVGMSPKTTRKTWESWLMFLHPERSMNIVQSQGHTTGTAMMHYVNMPFVDEDKPEMERYTAGFF